MPSPRRVSVPTALALAGVLLALLAATLPGLVQQRVVAALVFAWLVAVVGATSWRLASALARGASPSLFLLAAALVAFSLASAVVALTGAAGAFRLPAVAALLATAAWLVHRRAGSARTLAELLREARGAGTFAPAAAACALLLAAATAFVWFNQLRYAPQDADSMWYHLVMPAEWVRTGSTWPSDAVPLLGRAYPGFRQAIVALLSLPMRSEHVALLGAVELPVLALATYVLARSFGAARALATAGALAAATTPVVLGALSTQGNDLAVAILVMAGAVFVPRVLASGQRGDAVLAGLALGALAATKFSGPGYAAGILVLAALQHGVRQLRSWRVLAALAVGPLLLAAPWYLRNLLAFGNPLFPARLVVGGSTVFDGPLDRPFFASQTLGWNVAPLLEHAGQFVEAHGWLAPLAAVAFALFVVRRWCARQPLGAAAVGALLSPLLFLVFLHHPFNQPSFEASYSHRYLIAWASVGFATLAAATPAALRWPFGVACAGSAALSLAAVTRLAWPLAGLAVAGAALLACAPARAAAANVAARAAAARWLGVAALAALALAAFGVETLRARWQYDPALGYHDGRSERGWAGCASYVHREVAGARVGLHGSFFLFPLLGEPWSNAVRLADEPLVPGEPKTVAEVAAWAVQQRLDVLVCCRGRVRTSAREFTFAPSIGPALLAAEPQRFRLVHESDGAMVLAVAR